MFTIAHYIHFVGLVLLLFVVLIRSKTLFIHVTNDQPDQNYRRIYVACQHLSLTIIALSGIYLLYHKDFHVQPWFYAKIMLFAVLLSSLIKAFKKPDANILMAQRKVGLLIAFFCYVSILALVFFK